MAEKKILIIDYDPKSLDNMALLFAPYRYQIIKATDGLAGYEAFKSEKPDLIILEAMLPKLHGFDLTKKISQETNGNIPIIIVTGLYRGPQYKNEALNYLGASDYFEKPIDDIRLVQSALNHLKEGEGLEEELPDSDSVISNLSKRIKAGPRGTREEKEIFGKKETRPLLDKGELDDSWEKAFSEIDVDVTEKLSSLLKEKKKRTQGKR